MHRIQIGLLKLAETQDVANMRLADLARVLHVPHLQQIKHHREQLIKIGQLKQSPPSKKVLRETISEKTTLLRIPVLGSVSAGPALVYASGEVTGYIHISSSFLPSSVTRKPLYALRVVGRSMNRAAIGPQKLSAEEGDYVIADGSIYEPKNNDYVISSIQGKINIKKLIIQKDQISLMSESSDIDMFPPIIIQNDDSTDYLAQSKVIHVMKTPKTL